MPIQKKHPILSTVCLITLLFFSSQNIYSVKVYEEAAGIVMMEAENTESALDLWIKGNISGSSGTGNIEFTGNSPDGTGSQRSPLHYTFKITTPGDYALLINGRRSDQFTDTRKDIGNDAYVRVEGNYTVGSGGAPDIKYLNQDQKIFVGRGGYQDATGTFDWRWGEKLDIHGLSVQPRPIYNFKAGETYTLIVSGRSTYFCIDRILFVKTTVNLTEAKAITTESESFDDGAVVERYAYEATKHFSEINAGTVPFYIDNIRDALAVDASVVANRDKFARATTTFTGKTGTYDISLTTISESDGECTYRFLINGEIVGTYQNERITPENEYKPQKVIFKAISLQQNDEIAVEANTHTNGIFSEGNDGGTAWARGRWRSVSMKVAVYQGRIAVVADGNYRDSDDIIGTPVSLAILKSFGLNQQLVHYSHSCDLKPGSNDPGGKYRETEMQISCDGTASRWGGFDHLTFYNCMTQKAATIADLTTQINASTETDPLWIIEAGEPDIIWEAINNCDPSKRKYIFIVTHHPANDVGDFYDLSDVMALGIPSINLHSIPDQNTLLKTPLSDWYWARDHEDDRIKWLWERGLRAQSTDMNYPAIVGKFDCSDAGMIYYWATINEGGDFSPDVPKLKKLFLDYLASAPAKVVFLSPKASDMVLPLTDLEVEAELTVNAEEIDSVTLFINGVAVRTISVAPFAWGTNDVALKNMSPGIYNLKLIAMDTAMMPSEASLKIVVPEYAYFISPGNGIVLETGSSIDVEAGLNVDESKLAGIELFINDVLVRKITTAPFTWGSDDEALNDLSEGAYELMLLSTSLSGDSSRTKQYFSVETIPVQSPYSGTPIAIPGKFEAEDYDLGGEGVAYHDNDDINQSGEYRNDGIDIGTGGSGYVIGYTIGGEYTEYTIDVEADGNYDIILHYSSGKPTGGATIAAELPEQGITLIEGFVLPKTASWPTYETITLANVSLSRGVQVIRFTVIANGFNMDWFEIKRTDNVGTQKMQTNALTIFPNPARGGYFRLSKESSWSVFSLAGVQLLKGNGSFIDLSDHKKGMYIVLLNEKYYKIMNQ